MFSFTQNFIFFILIKAKRKFVNSYVSPRMHGTIAAAIIQLYRRAVCFLYLNFYCCTSYKESVHLYYYTFMRVSLTYTQMSVDQCNIHLNIKMLLISTFASFLNNRFIFVYFTLLITNSMPILRTSLNQNFVVKNHRLNSLLLLHLVT